jgi:antirestriction protein
MEKKDAEDIREEIAELLQEWSRHGVVREEAFVSDWEAPEYARFGEYPDWEEVAKVQAAIDEHGEEVVSAALALEVPMNKMEAYRGKYDDEVDYAYQWIDETDGLQGMPDHLAGYFDYEKFARDLFIDDVHGHRVNGYLHVFCRNW